MTSKTPRRAAEAHPGPPAALPSVPPAPAAAEGDRLPLTAAARGNPAAEVRAPAPASAAGPKQPGPTVGREEPAAGPGDQPEALSGEAFRKAFKAANSAKSARQRNQRARPWIGRDPLRKAVPGGRKPPPNTGEQQ
jgi:hypothetical protein